MPIKKSELYGSLWKSCDELRGGMDASLIGPDISIPVRNGRLVLGTWQQVVHLEMDVRERNRSVLVTVQGD